MPACLGNETAAACVGTGAVWVGHKILTRCTPGFHRPVAIAFITTAVTKAPQSALVRNWSVDKVCIGWQGTHRAGTWASLTGRGGSAKGGDGGVGDGGVLG